MDKSKVVQTLKKTRLNYLLWIERVEAGVTEGRDYKRGKIEERFGYWHAEMAQILGRFEEYQALSHPHERAYEQFMEIQAELNADQARRGWLERLFSSQKGRDDNHRLVQLLDEFYRAAATVVEYLKHLERRLIMMRPIEWEQHLGGIEGLAT